MLTSARIERVEQATRSAFTLADARANLSIAPIPSPGNTPASKIAAALKADAIQAAAPDAVRRIRDGLNDAVTKAEREIDAIAAEAAAAHGLAAFILGKADELPVGAHRHLKQAALAMRGQSSAPAVARQLQLAAENAGAEVARLREKYLPRTKLSAALVGHKKAHAIYEAAGLERQAKAAHLLEKRAQDKLHAASMAAANKRIGT